MKRITHFYQQLLRRFVPKVRVVGIAATAFALSSPLISSAQTGYIYVTLKQLDESQNQPFRFTRSSSITGFTLNDNGANFQVADIGSSQNGRFWAIGKNGTNPNALYYRNIDSSGWAATTMTNLKRVDGAELNSAVVITTSNEIYKTTGSTQTLIGNTSNAFFSGLGIQNFIDITYNSGGNITVIGSTSLSATSGRVFNFNGIAWSEVAPSLALNVNKIDGSLTNSNIVYATRPGTSNGIYTLDIASNTSTLLTNAPTGTTGTPLDIACDALNNVYAIYSQTSPSGNFVFKYSSGSFGTAELQSRTCNFITGGIGGQVWISGMLSTAAPFSNIYTRTNHIYNSQIVWLDDERVRANPTTGNAIMIPVTAGPHTITKESITGWITSEITVMDPTNNSSSNPAANTATLNVAAGEIVHVVFGTQLMNPITVGTNCGVAFTENFGSGAASVGPPKAGLTAYHNYELATGVASDGYYAIRKNSSGWGNSTLSDHTGLTDGYFLQINASYTTDEFYKQRVTNLIIGNMYSLSFWVADLSPSAVIRPNITFGVADINTKAVLSSVNTGNIVSPVNGVWQKFSYEFVATQASLDLFFRNNTIGGSGNDFAIDDISFNIGVPQTPQVALTQTTCAATTGSIVITSPLDNSPVGTEYEYSITGTGYTTNRTYTGLNPGIYSVNVRLKNTTCSSTHVDTIKYTICGSLFSDHNGTSDNLINGSAHVPPVTTYVALYDSTKGRVIAYSTVSATGTFDIKGIPGNRSALVLTTTLPVINATSLPVVTNAPGWMNTAENLNSPSGHDGNPNGVLPLGALTGNATAYFGLQTYSHADTFTSHIAIPNVNQSILLNGGSNPPVFTGSDPVDQPVSASLAGKKVAITTLPNHGELWYNGVLITAPNTILPGNYNPNLMEFRATGRGYSSVTFNYAYVDNANVIGYNAPYTLSWDGSLPLHLVSFTGVQNNCEVRFHWETANERNFSHFELEHSRSGADFTIVKKIAGDNVVFGSKYHTDAPLTNGHNFFRLKIVDKDATYAYSKTLHFSNKCESTIVVYPNPASDILNIDGLSSDVHIQIYSINGSSLMNQYVEKNNPSVNISNLTSGIYQLIIYKGDEQLSIHTFTKK